jgi:hypothetical protein
MRKRRLLVAAGACLAAVSLTTGTALADPVPAPPPYPPIVSVGAQTSQELYNQLCNNDPNFRDSSGNRLCQSWNVEPQPSNITTRDPVAHPECTIARPTQSVSGEDALVQHPTCVDVARVVSDDHTSRTGQNLTFIPNFTDALSYVVRSDSTIPLDLSTAELTAIYNCDPNLTFPSNPHGIKPLLGLFGAGNRSFFLKKLGITDSANLVNQPGHTCIKDTDSNGQPILANDGRYLIDPQNIITYSSGPWLAQVFQVQPDLHGLSVLGSINGISPAILNDASFMSRPIFNVVPTGQIGAGTLTNQLFVGPTSKACSTPVKSVIQRFGFNLVSNCGDTSIHTN